MVNFINEDFLSSDLQGRGTMVIDCNLQGVWETGVLRKMKTIFPKMYKNYIYLCLSGSHLYKPGDAIAFSEDGYNFVFLMTKNRRKTSKEDILSNFEKAVKNLLFLVPSDVYLYSPVMGREDKCFSECLKIMKKLVNPERREWFIYRKNFRS